VGETWRSPGGHLAVNWTKPGGNLAVNWTKPDDQLTINWRSTDDQLTEAPQQLSARIHRTKPPDWREGLTLSVMRLIIFGKFRLNRPNWVDFVPIWCIYFCSRSN